MRNNYCISIQWKQFKLFSFFINSFQSVKVTFILKNWKTVIILKKSHIDDLD